MDSQRSPEPPNDSVLGWVNRHRGITALFVASAVAGALIGAFQLPDDIALARRVIGGAISGVGVLFLMTATKLLN